jgi:hypothetical protein
MASQIKLCIAAGHGAIDCVYDLLDMRMKIRPLLDIDNENGNPA